ncbi:MAG: PEP-CTERM sorting domain-containing protein, partial [Planctomycetota bacterium]
VYGVATTTHGNVVQQAYPGETWTDVTEGYLYTDAVFCDGTYEDYEAYMTSHSRPYEPDDQDGSLHVNSYFALIKSGNEVIGESDISYQSVCGQPWDYEITGWVSRDAIGLGCNTEYALFFSLECGNDGAEHGSETGDCPVPEPAGASLMLIGLLLARRRRR